VKVGIYQRMDTSEQRDGNMARELNGLANIEHDFPQWHFAVKASLIFK
jgi:hypothetical protein